ncbi:unnamed protein product [Durusdinium trenchii]|uniref:FAST kinase leucine-rich domain-containing protein n=1 Tax=Durusdinium trenchii TaxID=1381693 RepID=A0ABP0JY26_9DINO
MAEASAIHMPFLKTLAPFARSRLPEANVQEMTQLAWAMATLEFHDEALLDALLTSSLKSLDTFSPAQLAGLAWSCARLIKKNSLLLDALLHVDLAPFDAQQLALFAWALARLGLRGAASAGESAFGRIATKVVELHAELRPQSVSNLAWCFAAAAYSTRAGGEPEHLLALAAQAQQHVAELEAQHVANRA